VGLAGQYHPPGFVAWTTPEWTVISGDRRSNRPQVAEAYRRHGAQVLNTAQVGAITVAIDTRGLRVATWRHAQKESPRARTSWDDEDPALDESMP